MTAAKVARSLAVPLRVAPILFIGVFSVLAVMATYAGLFGIPLALLVFFGFFRYSFALLDGVTHGAAEPPVLTIEMMQVIGEMRSLVVLAVVAAVFFGTDAASYWMGPFARAAIGLAVLTVLLAVITVQAATGSLLQAVDPRRWVTLIERLRGDYALIVACAAVLYLLGCQVARLEFLPLIARVALLMYAWLALFALIGGVLWERRLEISFDDHDDPQPMEPDLAALERQREQLNDRIYGEWRSGAHKNAWQTITVHLEQSSDPLAELRRLYERISRWPDPRLANRLAQELAARLLAIKRYGEMFDLIGARLRVNPDFRPLTSGELIRWIQIALQSGERRIARILLKDFQRLYPEDAQQARIEELRQQMEH